MSFLEIKNLNFSYPNSKILQIKNLNFSWERSLSSLGLIGANGSGKTTLLLLLNAILKAQSGSIHLEGKPISLDARLSCGVGFVFQDPQDQLFMPTLYDDVAFGPNNMGLSPEEVHLQVREALDIVGLWDKREFFPGQLSLGQRRRGAIACVLSMRPKLLCLDEPSSNLDPRAKRDLIKFLVEFQKGGAGHLLVSSHDFDFLEQVGQELIVLENGQLVGRGKTMDILRDKDFLQSHSL
jgi:cobalt/nickel transport system ATP-binding protein